MTSLRILLLAPILLAGCAGLPPSQLPTDSAYMVTVKTARHGTDEPLNSQLTNHTWFDLKEEDSWERVELLPDYARPVIVGISEVEAHADQRGGHQVYVIGLAKGDDASKMVTQIKDYALKYDAGDTSWPGPNDNTFVMQTVRATPGLHAQFFHNAIGKDYAPWLYAGPSATGSGVQLDTWLLGLQLGLQDGLQLHILQFTLGISWMPPGIDLPLLPRIGIPPRGD